MTRPLEIILVDDDPAVRLAVEQQLRKSKGRFKLASCITDLKTAETEIPKLCPDYVLMDILFPEGSGVRSVGKISRLLSNAHILMLTVSDASHHVFESLRAGAHGYIMKEDLDEKLLDAIENVQKGFADLSPSVARQIFEYFRRQSENRDVLKILTTREAEILRAMADGARNDEIARDFEIACSTLQTHLKNVYGKLHVHSRQEAISKLRS